MDMILILPKCSLSSFDKREVVEVIFLVIIDLTDPNTVFIFEFLFFDF
mgnify:CR=1 FL=1